MPPRMLVCFSLNVTPSGYACPRSIPQRRRIEFHQEQETGDNIHTTSLEDEEAAAAFATRGF